MAKRGIAMASRKRLGASVLSNLCTIGLLGCISFFGLSPGAWANDDTGTLIITLNAPVMDGAVMDQPRAYFIRAQRVDGKEGTQIRYEQSLLVKSPNDFESSGGDGAVFTKELSPGDWVVSLFQLERHSAHLRPTKEFAIPFKIQAGRGTYIGNFQPVAYKTNGGIDGVYFVVTDKSARDVPIARAHTPGLGPVDVSVFDVDTLQHPLFRSHDGQAAEPGEGQYCVYMNLLGCHQF